MDELRKLRKDFNHFMRLGERRWGKMLSYGRKTLNSEKRMRKNGKRVQIKRLNCLINIITDIRDMLDLQAILIIMYE